MKDTKPWYLSITIIGSVVAVASTGLNMAGYELSIDDQKIITDTVLSLGTIIGSLAAIYGRTKATKKVG